MSDAGYKIPEFSLSRKGISYSTPKGSNDLELSFANENVTGSTPNQDLQSLEEVEKKLLSFLEEVDKRSKPMIKSYVAFNSVEGFLSLLIGVALLGAGVLNGFNSFLFIGGIAFAGLSFGIEHDKRKR